MRSTGSVSLTAAIDSMMPFSISLMASEGVCLECLDKIMEAIEDRARSINEAGI
jgi:hypothetical protein